MIACCRRCLLHVGLLSALLVMPAKAAFALLPVERESILEAHNRERRYVGVPPLAWAEDLARSADDWAGKLRESRDCRLEHSRKAGLGENLYWASPVRYSDGRREVQQISAARPVENWAGEKKDFDPAVNACSAGGVCGHYTQVVWRDTREVGCAKAVCTDFSQVWVCNYRPAGNVVGRRPY